MSGFTWFYLGLGTAFACTQTEPGWMAAVFWWSIAALNEFVDRTL